MKKKCLEHQTLGQLVVHPSNPATQRIILNIVGFYAKSLDLKRKQKASETKQCFYFCLFAEAESTWNIPYLIK